MASGADPRRLPHGFVISTRQARFRARKANMHTPHTNETIRQACSLSSASRAPGANRTDCVVSGSRLGRLGVRAVLSTFCRARLGSGPDRRPRKCHQQAQAVSNRDENGTALHSWQGTLLSEVNPDRPPSRILHSFISFLPCRCPGQLPTYVATGWNRDPLHSRGRCTCQITLRWPALRRV